MHGDGFRNVVDPALAARYRAEGWWGDTTLADHVAEHVRLRPDAAAYVTPHGRVTWAEYDAAADRIAGALVAHGLEPGARVAVWLPDGATVHAALLANEKAGFTTVGIGARAGDEEVRHVLHKTGATALVTHEHHRDRDAVEIVDTLGPGLALRHHLVVPRVEDGPLDGFPVLGGEAAARRRVGPDDLFMINSTSGTTGLPKCVMHTQNRWMYFHRAAVAAGDLTPGEVILGAVPAPFGFGLWTAHFTPTLLGAPCVVLEKFSATAAWDLMEAEGVTMLAAVSTQFILMLAAAEEREPNVERLRVMFTGGEAVPYERARAFEARTGAQVLQFYGSNESGLATGTRLGDPPERRLRTAGRRVDGTELRLFAGGRDVTAEGRGQPGTRGPAVCVGYLEDADANRQLFTADGFVLHADICTLDDGWLTVVGRTSDIIIRGGKNISAAQVEDDVAAHPSVALAAAVPITDPVFGERVCVFVELRPGMALTLAGLTAFLDRRGVSKERWPERLEVLDALPRSSGGKVAKGELRQRTG